MRNLLFIGFFMPWPMAYAGVLVLDGAVYSVKEKELDVCGDDIADPRYAPALGLVRTARGIGERNADNLCQTGVTKYCDATKKKLYGLEQLFRTIRSYPSRTKNKACLALRTECESQCNEAAVISKEECLIECNQYESYNK